MDFRADTEPNKIVETSPIETISIEATTAQIQADQPDKLEPSGNALPLSLLQLFNMSAGFFGIQFAWGLQMANMSAIFEHLGAEAHAIPLLWLAAPLTGLIVQPLVGNLSDYTWGPLGRRRPYLLGGAVFASIALIFMPRSSSLWMAAGLLCLLDTSANVSMVPFRAWVGDLLPKEQRTQGFAMQSIMVGLGAIAASILPWLLNHVFAIDPNSHGTQPIPLTVELSFYLGVVVLLVSMVWTIATTPENPPKNLERFQHLQAGRGGVFNSLKEVWDSLNEMPATMRQLAWVQSLTWIGIFSFFLYFPTAVACNIFGAVDLNSALYNEGIEWAGICFALFNAVCVGFLFFLPKLTRWTSRKLIHGLCLAIGGISLVLLLFVHRPVMLLFSMAGFGIAWASALSIPFAILTHVIPPQRRGIYQGIFNIFIVLPEILMSLGFGWVMEHWLGDNRLVAVVLGGGFMLAAAVMMAFVQIPPDSMAEAEPEDLAFDSATAVTEANLAGAEVNQS